MEIIKKYYIFVLDPYCQMKNLLVISGALILFLASCKKEFTCTCTTTYVFKNNNTSGFVTTVIPGNDVKYAKKLSQKQANASCDDEQNSVQTSFINSATNSGTRPLQSGESVTTSCGLK